MNLNTLNVVMFTAGVILMYAAVKNRDPRDVVLKALGRPEMYGPFVSETKSTSSSDPDSTQSTESTTSTGTVWTSV